MRSSPPRGARFLTVAVSAMVTAATAASLIAATAPQRPAFPWETADVPESVRQGKPWQRALWALEELGYPDHPVPPGAREQAFDQIRALRRANPQLRALATWTNVGPTPLENRTGDTFTAETAVSGRVSAVAVNPQKKKEVVIGAAQGGIYMSSNGGKSWTSAGDDLKTLAIGSVAYAPGEPSTIYVGTGEGVFSGDAYAGVGVYKSTNGGKSWTLINQTDLKGLNIGAIIVDPDDADHLLMAAAGFGNRQEPFRESVGIYRSNDGGVTWSLRLEGHATDLVVDADDFNVQYAALGNIFGASENGVYRSTDGGESWTKLDGPWTDSALGRIELAISPSKPDVLYVSIQDEATFGLHGLFKSSNASGRNGARAPDFEEVDVPEMGDGWGEDNYCGEQCWYDHVLVVDPKKPDVLWAGGVFLWKLDGSDWDLVLPGHVDVHALAFSGNKQLFVGNDGGIFSTKNSGKSWTSHNDDLTLTQFYHGSISGLDYLMGGAQDNGTSVRDAGSARRAGDAWTRVAGGDGADNEVSSADPESEWAVSFQRLGLFRTTNGGLSWTDARGDINVAEAAFIAPFAMCPSDDDVFYAGTDRVWKTTEFFSSSGAPDWADVGPSLTSDTVRAIAVSPADPKCNTVAVATAAGRIFYSKNGGKKWNDADKRKQVPDRRITDLAFHPDDKKTLTLTLTGFDESGDGEPGHVFRSTNASKGKPSWKDIGPPVNLPFRTVAYQPGDAPKLWLGSDLGVWEQIDNARGQTEWVHHGADTGLPNVAVYDLRAIAEGVVAFTHGRGAWALEQSNTRRPR